MNIHPTYPVNVGIVGMNNVTITVFTTDEDFDAALQAKITPDMEQSWARFQFNRVRRRLAAEGGGDGTRYFSVDLIERPAVQAVQ